jgi:flagellar hook assembly protein FlgD
MFTNSEKISIYNKKGKLVKELYGPIEWNGVDTSGNLLSTGLYIVQYESGKQQYLKVIY